MTKTATKPAPRGADKHRDAEIRKIQIAKRWAICNLPGFDDDRYRDLLQEAGGKDSSTKLDWRGRLAVLKRFEELGWVPLPAKAARPAPDRQSRRQAGDDQSKMVRGLWIDLHTLGEVRDASEKALNAYVQRMTRVSDLSWCREPQKYVVIEALKDWRARACLKLLKAWALKVYMRTLPDELSAGLQTVLRGLRLGEIPSDTAIKHAGPAGYQLLIDYKRWEGVTYGAQAAH